MKDGSPKCIDLARLRRAAKCRKAGDLDGAEDLLQRLLSGNARHLGALIQRAEMAADQKKWSEAAVCWEQALSVCDAVDVARRQRASKRLKAARLAQASMPRGFARFIRKRLDMKRITRRIWFAMRG